MSKLGDVVGEVVPFFVEAGLVRSIGLRLRSQHNKATAGQALDVTWRGFRQLGEPAILDSLRSELSRRDIMQRRAQTFLGSIAVMSAFTIGAIGWFGRSGHTIPKSAIAVGIVGALVFLAGGAWFALRIVSPGQLYDLSLQSRMGEQAPISDEERLDLVLQLIQLNQAQNLLFATYSKRAYRCMRNALVSMLLVLLLLVLDALLT